MLTDEMIRDAEDAAGVATVRTEDEFREWLAFQIILLHKKIDVLLPNGEAPDIKPYNERATNDD